MSRNNSLLSRLQEAIILDQHVMLRYGRGSTPGEIRMVKPKTIQKEVFRGFISGPAYRLTAYCVRSKMDRHYLISCSDDVFDIDTEPRTVN